MPTNRMLTLKVLLLVGLGVLLALATWRFGATVWSTIITVTVPVVIVATILFAPQAPDPQKLQSDVLRKLHSLAESQVVVTKTVIVVWITIVVWTTIEVTRHMQPASADSSLVIETTAPVVDTTSDAKKLAQGHVGGYQVSRYYPTFRPMPSGIPDPDLRVGYRSERRGDTPLLRYVLPYREKLISGQLIEGIHEGYDGYFSWQYPKFAVRVLNNSSHTVQLSEALIKVTRSDLDLEPLPVIDGIGRFGGGMGLRIVNNGWGPIINPRIYFAVESLDPGAVFEAASAKTRTFPHAVRLPSIDTLGGIALEDPSGSETGPRRSLYIPEEAFQRAREEFRSSSQQSPKPWVGVVGRMEYETAAGERRSVPFRTGIEIIGEFGSGLDENSYTYSVCIPAGRHGVYTIPTSQSVKPGESDYFSIRFGTNRSARFHISVSFRAVGGDIIPAGDMILDVFVPARKTEGESRCQPT